MGREEQLNCPTDLLTRREVLLEKWAKNGRDLASKMANLS
jgi:hypothetical protein